MSMKWTSWLAESIADCNSVSANALYKVAIVLKKIAPVKNRFQESEPIGVLRSRDCAKSAAKSTPVTSKPARK